MLKINNHESSIINSGYDVTLRESVWTDKSVHIMCNECVINMLGDVNCCF